MRFFKKPGEYDENSFWFRYLADPELRAEHHAVRTREALDRLAQEGDAGKGRFTEGVLRLGDDVERLHEYIEAMGQYIGMLESRLMTLALYSRTTLQLMLDKGLVTHEEFTQRLQQLDLEDGKLDGR